MIKKMLILFEKDEAPAFVSPNEYALTHCIPKNHPANAKSTVDDNNAMVIHILSREIIR